MELKITRKADDMLFITTNGESKTDKNVWMIDKDKFYVNDFGLKVYELDSRHILAYSEVSTDLDWGLLKVGMLGELDLLCSASESYFTCERCLGTYEEKRRRDDLYTSQMICEYCDNEEEEVEEL